MAATDLAVRIATIFDSSGVKKADKGFKKLENSAKSLGRTLGISLSAAAVGAYAKASVKAYLDQAAQADRLAKLLKVTTGATDAQVASLNAQAEALSRVGVATGGSITQVQSQLATFNLQVDTIKQLTPAILDYVVAEKGANASTEEFKSLTNGLAQALNGNFTSLTRVGFVIDENTKKQIKNGTEAERAAAIVKVLDSTYKGFNESLKNTPQGQFATLAEGARKAQEAIGYGLVDAISMLGDKSGDVQNVADQFEAMGTYIGDAIRGIGVLSDKITNLPGSGIVKTILGINSQLGFTGLISSLGSKSRISAENAKAAFNPQDNAVTGYQATKAAQQKQAAAALKADKERAALTKKQLASQKALTAEQKKQASLKKAGTIFDLEQIQLIAALKGNLSKEERTRVEAQLALLNENDVLAQQLTKQILMAQDATGGLYQYFLSIGDAKIKNPFSFLDDWIIEFQKKLDSLVTSTPKAQDLLPAGIVAGYGDYAGSVTNQYSNELLNGSYGLQTAMLPSDMAVDYNVRTGLSYNANDINLTITGDGDLTNAIANALQNKSLSSGNTAYINRRTGGFE
jgi:hypothetical protein